MSRAEFKHLVDGDGTAARRTTDRLLPEDQSNGGYFHRLENRSDVMQVALESKRVEQASDVERDIDRGNDHVEASRQLFERIGLLGVVNEVRAELLGCPPPSFTSKTPSRIKENCNISMLPEDAMKEISEGIKTRQRFNAVVETGVPGFIPRGK
jgi:hypothetical protein